MVHQLAAWLGGGITGSVAGVTAGMHFGIEGSFPMLVGIVVCAFGGASCAAPLGMTTGFTGGVIGGFVGIGFELLPLPVAVAMALPTVLVAKFLVAGSIAALLSMLVPH